MNILQGLETWWAATEADVIAFIAKFKSGLLWTEQELAYALSWITNNAGQINSAIAEINGALGSVVASGLIKVPSALPKAIEDANKGVAALNAMLAAVQAGKTTADTVVDAYSALKTAQSSAALATIAVVNAPPAVAPVASP